MPKEKDKAEEITEAKDSIEKKSDRNKDLKDIKDNINNFNEKIEILERKYEEALTPLDFTQEISESVEEIIKLAIYLHAQSNVIIDDFKIDDKFEEKIKKVTLLKDIAQDYRSDRKDMCTCIKEIRASTIALRANARFLQKLWKLNLRDKQKE